MQSQILLSDFRFEIFKRLLNYSSIGFYRGFVDYDISIVDEL